MNRSRLLLVEDNPELCRLLTRGLRNEYRVECVPTLTGAFSHIAENTQGYDVVVLDRVLPDGDGLELLPTLQTDAPQTKICILSHKCVEAERVLGLEKGADCYLPKPTSMRELRANLTVLSRRSKVATPQGIQRGSFLLIEEQCSLVTPYGSVRLSRRQSEFLAAFLRAHDGRVTQEQLLNIFWRRKPSNNMSLIHVNIQRLRRRIEPIGLSIQSLYGLGYQLNLPQSGLVKTV
jgi:two-component system, OmpR family, response regulator